MDQALIKVGLPVRCGLGDCEITGFVKPHTDHDGWYKSKLLRMRPRKRWFCPEHYEVGRAMDNKFYENFRTPDPYPTAEVESTVDELYKLLD